MSHLTPLCTTMASFALQAGDSQAEALFALARRLNAGICPVAEDIETLLNLTGAGEGLPDEIGGISRIAFGRRVMTAFIDAVQTHIQSDDPAVSAASLAVLEALCSQISEPLPSLRPQLRLVPSIPESVPEAVIATTARLERDDLVRIDPLADDIGAVAFFKSDRGLRGLGQLSLVSSQTGDYGLVIDADGTIPRDASPLLERHNRS